MAGGWCEQLPSGSSKRLVEFEVRRISLESWFLLLVGSLKLTGSQDCPGGKRFRTGEGFKINTHIELTRENGDAETK